jgi:hypothetical protein
MTVCAPIFVGRVYKHNSSASWSNNACKLLIVKIGRLAQEESNHLYIALIKQLPFHLPLRALKIARIYL